MSAVALERSARERLTDAAVALKLRQDADWPWWAIELLDLRPGTDLWRVRAMLRYDLPRASPMVWNLAAQMVEKAERVVMQKSIEEWRGLAESDERVAKLVRDAGLYNPRAFCQLIDLRDEEDGPIVLKQFHLQMVRAMRQKARPSMVQAFWGAGKSFISSTVVPLMDWSEWPTATEGRIYLDEDLAKKWTGRLMQQVETNAALHQIFPWVDKPQRGDPGHKIWSYDGFAIRGNPIQQRSFEAHTIGSSKTGFRFTRTGFDDVVSPKEAGTTSIQERNMEYTRSVALTMRQITRRPRSAYGTVFPSFYIVGTPYERGDLNVSFEQEYREKSWPVLHIPIFIGEPERARWPERHSDQVLAAMREEMGPRAFNMRCRLQVGGREHSMFPEFAVDWALKDGRTDRTARFAWCQVPPQTRLIIGFDPAKGGRVQHHGARYPAFVVYGVRDLRPAASAFSDRQPSTAPVDLAHHVIQWGRLEGVGFHSQCEKLVELSHIYNAPVAFEDNGLQVAYGEQIARIAQDVRTFTHTTNQNVRDPVQGVEQFEPILRNQRLIIHADGAPPDQVKAIRDELIGWPHHAFSDLVMALWVARRQFSLHLQAAEPPRILRREMPDYVRRFTGGYRSHAG